MADRCEIAGVDFFNEVPDGADATLRNGLFMTGTTATH
jgi:hypothetical protein